MTNKLASLASEASSSHWKGFKPRISFLDSVVAAWAANEEVGEISQVFVNVVYIQLNNSKVMIKGLGLVMSLNVLMMMKMLMIVVTLDLEIKKGLKVSSRCMRAHVSPDRCCKTNLSPCRLASVHLVKEGQCWG